MTSWSSRNVSPGNRRKWLPWRRRPFQASDDHNAVLAGDLVRHEMLHALLRATGHRRSAFIVRCSGIVVCIDRCITDGGPAAPPDPNARLVDPKVLRVGVTVTPVAPSSATNGGNFMMIVTAENTDSTPVIAQLPPSGDAGPRGILLIGLGELGEAAIELPLFNAQEAVQRARLPQAGIVLPRARASEVRGRREIMPSQRQAAAIAQLPARSRHPTTKRGRA
jgi:hypothetical protein